ncbi:5-formyltetrahydrofolate cyclo-ligase [Methylocella silvestris BL2]|uniref:5-formyltetrahydrofolate cyclo-ligase n=1 Tax=Methylocella silvestris (strain DSM 15510 / CIP 108128 / LMG 27833 / NCIMB 13906 / BL2) TaxID=395965 RepID=B8EI92_METSB|nr:5-formyltetrahydrofolate cyclo-ligase [Methylocella silvestris]ACK51211.1 5-formyltetrahydrofolate cyclo-ligase [Methylocella silvestris BL2]
MQKTPLSKQVLRSEALARRRAASAVIDSEAFAAHLAVTGAAIVAEMQPGIVSAYFSLRDEASTMPLIETLAERGVLTALPITGARGTPLVFRLWRPGDALVSGKMGISEPAPAAAEVAPDLLFVPLAAFDRSGHRIGYGAGFYDRTLASLRARKKIVAVGVAYASQETGKIPHEEHDQRLDFVLTEKELIDCRVSDSA